MLHFRLEGSEREQGFLEHAVKQLPAGTIDSIYSNFRAKKWGGIAIRIVPDEKNLVSQVISPRGSVDSRTIMRTRHNSEETRTEFDYLGVHYIIHYLPLKVAEPSEASL